MTAALVLSDVHLREESAELVLGQILPELLALCQAQEVRRVLCLGDLWHMRYRVPVALQNGLYEQLRAFGRAGVAWKILPGNHDQIDARGRNALEVFDELDNVTVHSAPGWDEDGLWVPYRPEMASILDALALPKPERSFPDVCYLHYGVRGAMRNSRFADTDGVEPHRFNNFAWVLCGHYHKQQALGRDKNIVYVGSPYQTRADEAGDPKGVVLFDPVRPQQMARLQQRWGERYVGGRLASVDDVAALVDQDRADAATPGTQFRLSVAAGVDLKKVGAALEARGIERYTLTPEPQPHEVRLAVPEGESVEAYARAYMQAHGAPDAQDALWATFRRLTEGKHDAAGSL